AECADGRPRRRGWRGNFFRCRRPARGYLLADAKTLSLGLSAGTCEGIMPVHPPTAFPPERRAAKSATPNFVVGVERPELAPVAPRVFRRAGPVLWNRMTRCTRIWTGCPSHTTARRRGLDGPGSVGRATGRFFPASRGQRRTLLAIPSA